MTEYTGGAPKYLQLLESGALELRKTGTFETEFSPEDLEQIMRQVVAQSEEAMRKKEVKARIDRLRVRIADGAGEVDTDIIASKKVLWGWPEVGIAAKFGIENVVDASQQPVGRLRTTHLEVEPETLFGIIKPRAFLAEHIEGENINGSFKGVLDKEMQSRGVKIDQLRMAFTPENKLSVQISGTPIS